MVVARHDDGSADLVYENGDTERRVNVGVSLRER